MFFIFSAAGCTPFAVSIIGDYFPADLRGTAISIYYFGIYIGYSLAFAIGNGIVDALSWRWVFYLSGLIGTCLYSCILYRMVGNFCMVQNFAVFVYRASTAKIRTMKLWTMVGVISPEHRREIKNFF